MITSTSVVSNNSLTTGHLLDLTILLEFCGTLRIVSSEGVYICETLEKNDNPYQLQALIVLGKYDRRWEEKIRLRLDISRKTPLEDLTIRLVNFKTRFCYIERHPHYAVAKAELTYDMVIIYKVNNNYKLVTIKELTTSFAQILDCVPPAECTCICTCSVKVVDWFSTQNQPLLSPDRRKYKCKSKEGVRHNVAAWLSKFKNKA